MKPNYGLAQDLIREVGEYVLGSAKIPCIPFNESGDWEEWLPKYENQTTKLGEETSGCTVHGSQNQIETLHKFLYKDAPNYSERYTYNLVPVTPFKGTDPQNTHECIRKHGLIDEQYLPMTNSLIDYIDKTAITGSLLAKGQYWLARYDYKHEWVWSPNKRPANYIDILKDALTTCPLAVSVSAWNLVGDEYVSYGDVNNHYCLLYKIDAEGHPWVFDTYDHSKKKLSKDHNIRRAKRIWLQKKTKREMGIMVKLLQNIVKSFMKPTLADVAKKYLGKDASPEDLAPDDLSCSESVTTIMRELYPETPIITGTASLHEYLDDPRHGYVRVTDYLPGTIVLSPTGFGVKGTIGHVGICLENELIASSNSFGILKGLFTQNYNPLAWRKRYVDKQGMPVFLYRRV